MITLRKIMKVQQEDLMEAIGKPCPYICCTLLCRTACEKCLPRLESSAALLQWVTVVSNNHVCNDLLKTGF